LGHCGFAVRSGDRLLVFDYQDEYGTLSEGITVGGLEGGIIESGDLADLETYVFVTHPHDDHFDEVVLEWEEDFETIQYFFGW
jgi:L-ascorbate metabolism protein UlaG (beta-lactamase superfamily)